MMKKIVTFTITESDPERVGIVTLLLAEAGVDFAVAHRTVANGADRLDMTQLTESVPAPARRPMPVGIKRRRLTSADVVQVKLLLSGKASRRSIARTVGISTHSVDRIAKGNRDYLIKIPF